MTSTLQSPQQKHAQAIFKALKKVYPEARTELVFENPLELLVGTILSAQCTDVRVNLVTPALFKRYKTIQDYAQANFEELDTFVRSINFHPSKARNIIAACKKMHEFHGGKIPQTMEELCTLPGIGRKSANVILSSAFGLHEGIVVDTHVIRLSGRLGLSKHRDPLKIEQDLLPLLSRRHWALFSHLLVWHGRRRCFARKPDCPHCEISHLCPSFALLNVSSK